MAVAVLVVASSVAGGLGAQERGTPLRLGEVKLYPSLRVEYVRDTNVFLTADDEVEADGVVLTPRLEAVADRRLLELRARYRGSYAGYSEEVLDYANHFLALEAAAEIASRRRVRGELSYAREHERLGTERTRDISLDVDEQVTYDRFGADGSFTYGAEGARGNVTAGLALDRVSYVTLGALTDRDDFTMVRPYGIFSYRLSPDTRMLAELRYGSFAYSDETEDRTDLTALVGLTLGARGKSGGSAKVGGTFSDYAADGRDTRSSLVAEIDLFYLPKPYARFGLTLDRRLDDLEGVPDASDVPQTIETQARLSWNHEWSSRVSTTAFVLGVDEERGCPERDALALAVGFELSLMVRRWLSVGLGGTSRARDITACGDDEVDLDNERQTFGAHLRATL